MFIGENANEKIKGKRSRTSQEPHNFDKGLTLVKEEKEGEMTRKSLKQGTALGMSWTARWKIKHED